VPYHAGVSTSANRRVQESTLDRAIEGTWLTCAALVPLIIVPDTWMVGYVQVPKVFLLRTAAILLVVLMALRWARESRSSALREGSAIDVLRASVSVGGDYLRTHPIMLAATAVVGANFISLLFSPMRTVSLGGVDPGWDGYSVASVASYVVLFVAVATGMRSVAQVRRLLWALTISSLILSVYGAGQYLGFDLFREELSPGSRIWLSFGSPTFGAAYLVMTIPLTLGLWQSWRERFSPVLHVVFGMALVMPQVAALALTLSRGGMISMVFSLLVFVALSAWVFGLKRARPPTFILGAGLAILLVVSFLPLPGVPSIKSDLQPRVSSIGSSFTAEGGGLSGRYTIWGYAATAFGSIPWADTEEFPEIPELTVKPLRRLVGYGPDLFRYAISFAGGKSTSPDGPGEWQNAHNFLIHATIEIGLLGALAYLGLMMAVGLALNRLLRAAREGVVPEALGYLFIGLAATFAGRGLEQMTGKAQVSDIALSWILIGVVVGLASITANMAGPAHSVSNRRGNQRSPRARAYTSSGVIPARYVRLAIVVAIALAATALWSQAVVSAPRASLLLGEALRAGQADGGERTSNLMRQAMAATPDDSTPRILLGEALLRGASDLKDTALQLQLLNEAYAILIGVFDRNPMEYRSRVAAANVAAEMMLFDSSFAPTAIRHREVSVALSPWLWKPRQWLATTLFQIGSIEAAMATIDQAKSLGAKDNPQAYYVYYIDAKAKLAFGRNDEALISAHLVRDSPYTPEILQEYLNRVIEALSE
jgi:hypothetical protein